MNGLFLTSQETESNYSMSSPYLQLVWQSLLTFDIPLSHYFDAKLS